MQDVYFSYAFHLIPTHFLPIISFINFSFILPEFLFFSLFILKKFRLTKSCKIEYQIPTYLSSSFFKYYHLIEKLYNDPNQEINIDKILSTYL